MKFLTNVFEMFVHVPISSRLNCLYSRFDLMSKLNPR